MSKPTLVLVHGSWHSPEHFGPLRQNLESNGYKCVPVALPSTQSPDLPPASFSDDTAAVRNTVLDELNHNNVVVITHSYGGAPTNNALEGLDATSQSKNGPDANAVKAIVFLCSFLLPKGVSILDTLGGHPAPIHNLKGDFCYVNEPGPEHYFYNDLPSSEASKWAALLRPQAWQAYALATSYTAYKDFPCGYLFCTLDQALPVAFQKGMVEAAKADGGRFEFEETLESSHSPFLSKVEETGAFVRRVAEAVSK